MYAHLDDDLARRPAPQEGRHPLPSPQAFIATLGRLGIGRDSRVIVYDDQGGAIAARLWWMLGWIGHERRAMLNGGIVAWRSAGLPLDIGSETVTQREYPEVPADDSLIVTTEELQQHVAAHATDVAASPALLDARAAARFRGEVEPIDPVAGHVPGALNLAFSDLLDSEQRFLSPGLLRQRFTDLLTGNGRNPDTPVVTMCGSGVTACHLLAGLALTGRTGRLYVGSWSEWIRDPQRPIASGN